MSDSQVELRPDFPGLDWLRAVGALAVVTTHVAFQTGAYARQETVGTMLARLDIGVAIFFVLSGFLLSREWWARAQLGLPRPATRRYAVKRALRIMPVYVVTVLATILVVPGNSGRSAPDWLATLLVGDVYVDDSLPQGLTQMWSLTAEVAFYVVLPGLMLVASRRIGRIALATPLLVAMVVVTIAWILVVVPAVVVLRDWAPNLWLPGYLVWFAAGMWLSREHVRWQADRSSPVAGSLARLGAQPGVCWSLAAGLFLLISTPLAGPVSLEPGTLSEALLKNLVYTGIAVAVVIPGIWGPRDSAFLRVVSSRPLRHLGHVSYGVFCVHLIVLAVLLDTRDYQLFSGDFARIWVLVVAITLVVSEVLYWGVERPASRLGRRSRGSSSTQAPTTEHASSTR